MKNVLLLVHDDPGQEARVQVALDLTRALAGHLTCLDVTPIPLVYDQGILAGAIVIDEADQEAANKVRLWRRFEKEDVSWSWSAVRGDFSQCLIEAARTADIVILNRKLESVSRADMRAIASAVVTHSDALIVAVTENCASFDIASPALIAWDGSDAAMRAAKKAVPLLRLAAEIRIFQVGSLSEDAIPAHELAHYLSREGICAELEIAPATKQIPPCIQAALERSKAGYCVMGAFGHSRLREALFGGVSREMLASAPVPLVMAG